MSQDRSISELEEPFIPGPHFLDEEAWTWRRLRSAVGRTGPGPHGEIRAGAA